MKENKLSRLRVLQLGAVALALATMMICIPKPAFAQTPFTVTFDFDTGSPVLAEGRGTPFVQTSDPVTGSFGSPSDPAAFSVQSYGTTFFQLSRFSGKFLYDNNPSRDSLDITFSVPVTSISFVFATIEQHGGPTAETTEIQLTAYMNSNLVGSTTARGSFINDTYPQGTLSYNSPAQPFNLARIFIPYQAGGATDFLVDTVTVSGVTTEPSPTPSSSPGASASPSPSPSSSPTVPEFPSAAVLPLFFVAAATLVIASVKKLSKTRR